MRGWTLSLIAFSVLAAEEPGTIIIRAYTELPHDGEADGKLTELHFDGVPKIIHTPTGCVPYGPQFAPNEWRMTTCDMRTGDFLNEVFMDSECSTPVWSSRSGPDPLARGSYPLESGEAFQPVADLAGRGAWTTYNGKAIIWRIFCGDDGLHHDSGKAKNGMHEAKYDTSVPWARKGSLALPNSPMVIVALACVTACLVLSVPLAKSQWASVPCDAAPSSASRIRIHLSRRRLFAGALGRGKSSAFAGLPTSDERS
jgi:hypothetical protein